MEGKWQQLEEKSNYSHACDDGLVSCKKPKYIEEYNKAVEDILEKVKVHDKLKDNYSSTPMKASWKKEEFEIEDEIRKLKEKNNLRKSTIHDDIKTPTFTERYLQRQINKKTDVSSPQEVKKGAWRKDFARYEEDLEIKKLRKETEKKINSLDSDDSTSDITTNSRVKKICLQIVDKQTENIEVKPKPAKTTNSSPKGPGQKSCEYFSDSPTTFVTVKMNRQTEVDDSLTIHTKKNIGEKDEIVTKNKKDQSNLKLDSHCGGPEDSTTTQEIQDKSKDTKKIVASQDFISKGSEKKEESKRRENIKPEAKNGKSGEIKVSEGKGREEEVTDNTLGKKEMEEKEEGEEEEDADGMRAMRKETNNTLASLEAEFEAGRSKLAAVRARIKRAREMARNTEED